MAPVLPSGGATTPISSVNNALPKGSDGSMPFPSAVKLTTRRRAHSRKKTSTTTSATAINPATSSNDDEQGSSNGEEATKAAIKRVIRELVNRQ